MPRIVGVHGIAQQYEGEATLKNQWFPAISDGLGRNDVQIDESDFSCCFYGDLFRPSGTKSGNIPPLVASDLDAYESELASCLNQELCCKTSRQLAQTKARTPSVIQDTLRQLSRSKFFAGCAEHLLIWNLRQVRLYMSGATIKQSIKARFLQTLSANTRVVVAHSLGSIVAYEALFTPPAECRPIHLVTIGSPLGIRNLIFDKLNPPPSNGKGRWPPIVRSWTNIADAHDIVALNKSISGQFEGKIEDRMIDNGSNAHSALPYLTSIETGTAIAQGIAKVDS